MPAQFRLRTRWFFSLVRCDQRPDYGWASLADIFAETYTQEKNFSASITTEPRIFFTVDTIRIVHKQNT